MLSPLKHILILALLLNVTWLQAQSQDIMDMTRPAPAKYLAGPPDSLSMAFAHDVHQYLYGMSLRDSERGRQAYSDATYSIANVATAVYDDFGVQVHYGTAMNELLNTACRFILSCEGGSKSYYKRRRPFDRFNDPLYSFENRNNLRKTGSYPSAHSILGWSVALLLTDISNRGQDAIFERGYEFGQSRTIVGAHWQSDVDASRLIASAGFSLLHTNEQYLKMLSLAQAEYDSLTHTTRPASIAAMHPLVNFIPDFPDNDAPAFVADLGAYYSNKSLRDSARGQQASVDRDHSLDGMMTVFAPLMGTNVTTLSRTASPHLYQLLETALSQINDNCDHLQARYARQAPYAQLNEPPLSGTLLVDDSSYPSRQSAIGWMTALLLMDVCPTYQNQILERGREYGQSAVIAGTGWQSDVDAGQLLAGMVLANLMSDPSFTDLITEAREEFNRVTGMRSIRVDDKATTGIAYLLDGRIAGENATGVVITNDGQKLLR